MSLAERRAAVLQGFARFVGNEALNPIEYVEHDWTKDPGRWAAPSRHRPRARSLVGSTIREPVGRVHWAGTETATYWSGFMDGAVRAGERAATEVGPLL